MNTYRVHPDTGMPRPKPAGSEARAQAPTAEIEHAIERLSTRYAADLRSVSEEVGRRIGTAHRERDTPRAPTKGAEPQQDRRAAGTGDASPPFIDPAAPQPGHHPAFAVSPRTIQSTPPPSKGTVLYRAEAPRAARRLHTRRRLVLWLASIAVLTILGAGLGQGLAVRREPDAVSTDAGGSSSARQDLIDTLRNTLTLPPPSPTVPALAPTATRAGSTALPHAEALVNAPTTSQLSATTMRQQVVGAQGALRTGQFAATIDYGNGTQVSAEVRFDLGDERHAPGLHLITTYQGLSSTRTWESITIGDRSWQRQSGGHWTATPAQGKVRNQVQVFLSHADAAPTPAIDRSGDVTVLHWYDADRDTDVTLQVDPLTGTPQQLHQLTRATGLVLAVTYHGWNTAVQISPPSTT